MAKSVLIESRNLVLPKVCEIGLCTRRNFTRRPLNPFTSGFPLLEIEGKQLKKQLACQNLGLIRFKSYWQLSAF